MKKLISSPVMPVILFLLFLIPAVSNASYLIRLKNGRELVTPMYWVEGKQIYFYYGGGIAGIEGIAVDRVERCEKETEDYMDTTLENMGKKELPPLSSITEKAPGLEKSTVGFEPKPSMSNAPKIDKKEDTKKDPDLMREFNKLEKKFELRKSMTIDELKDLKNDLIALRDKIVSSRLEADFREEGAKIADMKFFINDLLIIKSRSH